MEFTFPAVSTTLVRWRQVMWTCPVLFALLCRVNDGQRDAAGGSTSMLNLNGSAIKERWLRSKDSFCSPPCQTRLLSATPHTHTHISPHPWPYLSSQTSDSKDQRGEGFGCFSCCHFTQHFHVGILLGSDLSVCSGWLIVYWSIRYSWLAVRGAGYYYWLACTQCRSLTSAYSYYTSTEFITLLCLLKKKKNWDCGGRESKREKAHKSKWENVNRCERFKQRQQAATGYSYPIISVLKEAWLAQIVFGSALRPQSFPSLWRSFYTDQGSVESLWGRKEVGRGARRQFWEQETNLADKPPTPISLLLAQRRELLIAPRSLSLPSRIRKTPHPTLHYYNYITHTHRNMAASSCPL